MTGTPVVSDELKFHRCRDGITVIDSCNQASLESSDTDKLDDIFFVAQLQSIWCVLVNMHELSLLVYGSSCLYIQPQEVPGALARR